MGFNSAFKGLKRNKVYFVVKVHIWRHHDRESGHEIVHIYCTLHGKYMQYIRRLVQVSTSILPWWNQHNLHQPYTFRGW